MAILTSSFYSLTYTIWLHNISFYINLNRYCSEIETLRKEKESDRVELEKRLDDAAKMLTTVLRPTAVEEEEEEDGSSRGAEKRRSSNNNNNNIKKRP